MPDEKNPLREGSPLRELAGKFKAAEEYRRKVSRDPNNSVTAAMWLGMSNLAQAVADEVSRVDQAHQALLDELWKMYYGAQPSAEAPDPMPGIVQRLTEIERLLGVRPAPEGDDRPRAPEASEEIGRSGE